MITEEEKEAIKNAKEEFKRTTFLSDIGHRDLGILLNLITKLQEENKKKDKVIDEIDTYCKHDLAFERRLKKDNREPDLFNQGRFSTCEDILKLLEGKDE